MRLFATLSILAFAGLVAAGPAAAAPEAKEGEALFKKRCFACHAAEKGAKNKTGPTLHGVFGAKPAHTEGFKYSKSYEEMAAKGVVWDERAIDEYILDPKKYVEKATGNPKAASKMTFKLDKKEEREHIIAYLKTLK